MAVARGTGVSLVSVCMVPGADGAIEVETDGHAVYQHICQPERLCIGRKPKDR